MTTGEQEETDLMRAVAAGDAAAFERLVARFQGPVISFLYRYAGDRPTAEDLAQETFLNVWRAARRFDPDGGARPSTWIFTIAYRLAMTELKRRRRFAEFRERASREGHDIPPGGPMADRAGSCPDGDSIHRVLAELPENQRAAMLLRAREEMSYREIAVVLGISVSAVESLIFRARTRLRRELADTERATDE